MTESPARRGTTKELDDQDDPLTFNLCIRQEHAFGAFRKAFDTIIRELHVPLAGHLDPKKCKQEDDFATFCLNTYGIKK